MAAVGLLYVGAILFLNGTMLLGWVDGKSAAPLNVFVGFLQVLTTYLIISADGDQTRILAASGLYLFGFTYFYVGWNLLGNLDGTGLGMFSLFVAVSAVVYSIITFDPGDLVFGVIWLYWSFLWYTGAVAMVQGWVTGALPAFLLLTGHLDFIGASTFAPILAIFAVVAFGALFVRMRQPRTTPRGVTVPRPA